MAKVKQRILQAARERESVSYKGTPPPIRLPADFSVETLQARRKWHDMFKVMKGKNLQPRILYPVRLLFRKERAIKNFSDKQKLKEFRNSKPALKEILKGLL